MIRTHTRKRRMIYSVRLSPDMVLVAREMSDGTFSIEVEAKGYRLYLCWMHEAPALRYLARNDMDDRVRGRGPAVHHQRGEARALRDRPRPHRAGHSTGDDLGGG